MAVEKALLKVPGVSKAEADLADKKASIDYDEAKASREQLVNAVTDAGYTVAEPVAEKGGGCCC
jgi:copper chaperone CopZ